MRDKPDEGTGGQQVKVDDDGIAQSLVVAFIQNKC